MHCGREWWTRSQQLSPDSPRFGQSAIECHEWKASHPRLGPSRYITEQGAASGRSLSTAYPEALGSAEYGSSIQPIREPLRRSCRALPVAKVRHLMGVAAVACQCESRPTK